MSVRSVGRVKVRLHHRRNETEYLQVIIPQKVLILLPVKVGDTLEVKVDTRNRRLIYELPKGESRRK